jgi:hypothetical protein
VKEERRGGRIVERRKLERAHHPLKNSQGML